MVRSHIFLLGASGKDLLSLVYVLFSLWFLIRIQWLDTHPQVSFPLSLIHSFILILSLFRSTGRVSSTTTTEFFLSSFCGNYPGSSMPWHAPLSLSLSPDDEIHSGVVHLRETREGRGEEHQEHKAEALGRKDVDVKVIPRKSPDTKNERKRERERDSPLYSSLEPAFDSLELRRMRVGLGSIKGNHLHSVLSFPLPFARVFLILFPLIALFRLFRRLPFLVSTSSLSLPFSPSHSPPLCSRI